MATKNLNQLTTTASAASGDLVAIWRVGDGDTRAITKANFMGGVLTGGGTIATGGFTLTVAAASTINGSLVGNMTGGGTVATGGNTLTVGGASSITGTLSGAGTVATGGNTLTVGGTSTINGSLVGSMTGSGTVATGGFTLTVPATGTASLLGTAQTFSALKTFSAGLTFGDTTLNTHARTNWTPAITGSGSNPTITYTTQVGEYLRLGNSTSAQSVVMFSLEITVNTISGGTGACRISLPLAVATVNSVCTVLISGPDATGTPIGLAFEPQAGTTYGLIRTIYDNAGINNINVTDLANSDVIRVSGFYFV